MSNRYLFMSIGVIFFVLIIPLSISFYEDYQVHKKGKIVEATIVSLPSSYSSKTEFMRFRIEEKIYDKKVYSSFSRSHKIGDKIQLKYLPEYESHFLFAEENPAFWNIVAILLFLIFGTWSFTYSGKSFR